MPPIKALTRISDKWKRQAETSQQDYEEGIRNPRADWAEKSTQANPNWKAGVTAAIQSDRYATGVKIAGTEKWARRAIELGPSRWAQGIQVAGDAYETGFAPYRSVIERLQLPARGPKGSPQNIRRVEAVATALHQEKMRRGK
jgi:hypothetical protein